MNDKSDASGPSPEKKRMITDITVSTRLLLRAHSNELSAIVTLFVTSQGEIHYVRADGANGALPLDRLGMSIMRVGMALCNEAEERANAEKSSSGGGPAPASADMGLSS